MGKTTSSGGGGREVKFSRWASITFLAASLKVLSVFLLSISSVTSAMTCCWRCPFSMALSRIASFLVYIFLYTYSLRLGFFVLFFFLFSFCSLRAAFSCFTWEIK